MSCSGPPPEILNDYARRVDLLRGIAEAKKLVCIVAVNFFAVTMFCAIIAMILC